MRPEAAARSARRRRGPDGICTRCYRPDGNSAGGRAVLAYSRIWYAGRCRGARREKSEDRLHGCAADRANIRTRGFPARLGGILRGRGGGARAVSDLATPADRRDGRFRGGDQVAEYGRASERAGVIRRRGGLAPQERAWP